MVTVVSWWLHGMAVATLWHCCVHVVVVVVDASSCLRSCSLVVIVAVVRRSGGARSGGHGSHIVGVLLPQSESWLRRSGRRGQLQQAKGVAPLTTECTATWRMWGRGHGEGAHVVGKGHGKPVSAAGKRHDEVACAVGAVGKWEVASGGTGEGHTRQCMCSCKEHRELDSARERIRTFFQA